MTKEHLKEYRSLQREVALLDKKLDRLYERQGEIPTVLGKVMGSSREFPYVPTRMTVEMAEPKEAQCIRDLIQLQEQRLNKARALIMEIEQFINDIDDSKLRQIFELTFENGMKQKEVAKIVCLDRSRVSRKIDDYLKRTQSTKK